MTTLIEELDALLALEQTAKAKDAFSVRERLKLDAAFCEFILLRAPEIRKALALQEFVDSNMTFYDTDKSSGPALSEVSKRIWYHATDDVKSYPFSEVAARKDRHD